MRVRSVFPFLALLATVACAASPSGAQVPSPNPALGMILRSSGAHIGDAAVAEGASIYSGDALSTADNGSMLVRVGTLSFELQGSSSAHVYRAPYGAVVELNGGTIVYTTPGTQENLVIVAEDVRATPDPAMADLGRVTIDNPCQVTVYSERGQVKVQSGSESRIIEQGKAYRVRPENNVSYRKYVSPDADDYHRYHEHEPCAPALLKGHLPLAPGSSHFLAVAASATGVATVVGIWKALESPDRP